MIYLITRYCIRTMQFHIMLYLFQINVPIAGICPIFNTGMRLRENHVVLLAITMERMAMNHILQSWYSNT